MAWTYGDSERIERVRRRAVRQKRIAALSSLAAVMVLGGGLWWLAVDSIPAPPTVTIAWPSPEKFGTRTFKEVKSIAKNEYELPLLMGRRGQPFTVTIGSSASTDAGAALTSGESQNWLVHAVSEDTDENGSPIHWSPNQNEATLKVFCRPVASGLQKLVAWLWPTYLLRVRAVVPVVDVFGIAHLPQVDKGTPVFLSEQVTALDGALWDERTIPLLEAAHKAIPLDSANGAVGSVRWQLVDGFSGFAQKRAPGDEATYVTEIRAEEPVGKLIPDATRVARFFESRSPAASIKFVISPDDGKDGGAESTFRLAFDGKASRAGWVKHAKESQATPLQWWESPGESDEPLAPSLPR